MVHCDKGYRQDPSCSTPLNQLFHHEREQSRVVRGRHETVNKRFKDWTVLAVMFRHPLLKHLSVFRAIAAIITLSMRHGSPLFHVDYQELTFLHACLNHRSLNVVFKALKSHPWLVPDRHADEDGIVYLHGGVATRRPRDRRGVTTDTTEGAL